jgi:hypothetical protein
MLTNLRPADLRLTTAQQRSTGQDLLSDLYYSLPGQDFRRAVIEEIYVLPHLAHALRSRKQKETAIVSFNFSARE